MKTSKPHLAAVSAARRSDSTQSSQRSARIKPKTPGKSTAKKKSQKKTEATIVEEEDAAADVIVEEDCTTALIHVNVEREPTVDAVTAVLGALMPSLSDVRTPMHSSSDARTLPHWWPAASIALTRSSHRNLCKRLLVNDALPARSSLPSISDMGAAIPQWWAGATLTLVRGKVPAEIKAYVALPPPNLSTSSHARSIALPWWWTVSKAMTLIKARVVGVRSPRRSPRPAATPHAPTTAPWVEPPPPVAAASSAAPPAAFVATYLSSAPMQARVAEAAASRAEAHTDHTDSPALVHMGSQVGLCMGGAPPADADAPVMEELCALHSSVVAGVCLLDEDVHRLASRVFACLRNEAEQLTSSPLTAFMVEQYVLRHGDLSEAMGASLAGKCAACGALVSVGAPTVPERDQHAAALREAMVSVLRRPRVLHSLLADLAKVRIADPACEGLLQPLFFFKGLQALTTHRVAHALWLEGGAVQVRTALFLQARVAELFAVDIHPAAIVGDAILLDHASGIVIGSTAVVGDNICMLHSVTLGATGKPVSKGVKRHPTVGNGCTLGAGCTVLGDVSVGDKATIGAAAVVTRSVPAGGTVIGVNNLLKRKEAVAAPSTSLAATEDRQLQAEAAPQHTPVPASAQPQTASGGVRDAFESRLESLGRTEELHEDHHTWFYDRHSVELINVYSMFGA